MNRLLLTLSSLLLFFSIRHKSLCTAHTRETYNNFSRSPSLTVYFSRPIWPHFYVMPPGCWKDVLFNSYRPYNSQTQKVRGREHSRVLSPLVRGAKMKNWSFVWGVRAWLEKTENGGEPFSRLPRLSLHFSWLLCTLIALFHYGRERAVRILPNFEL